ncbi:MAG: HAMP domain-containing protein [Myxococcales bacterium]|nr:HAMP domain-containing protein [Myxococcales bacterium]
METATPTSDAAPGDAPSRVVRRQLAIGFGLIAIIATAMCAMLLGTIREVSGVVDQMRQDEAAIRRGIELSAATREQYIHIAHSLLEGDRSHLEHYEQWRRQLADDARSLSTEAPADVRKKVEAVERLSTEMDRLFHDELLPAAEHGDRTALRAQHQRVEALSLEASSAADAVARAGELRMAAAHDEARRAGLRGLAMGGACIVAVVLVAFACTRRLQTAVLRPLAALAGAAGRFGRGDFGHRVGKIGRGELAELARAFDRMAEELADRERKLLSKERMAAIGALAAGVAHEINNPIGIIRGYIKTMLPEASDPQVREELQVLDEEAAACQRLTGDLLAYAETPRLEIRAVEMRAFLEDSAARLREAAARGGHALVVEATEGTIDADPGRLRQVLANLVHNATQASPKGAPIRISGRPSRARGYEFSITDLGPGVAPGDGDRIFEPFVSKRTGGSGLGLAVCRSIVVAHGGSIAVEPGPHEGARFRVELPSRLPLPKPPESE